MTKNKQFLIHKKHFKGLCLIIITLCILLVTPTLVAALNFDNIKLKSDILY